MRNRPREQDFRALQTGAEVGAGTARFLCIGIAGNRPREQGFRALQTGAEVGADTARFLCIGNCGESPA